MCVWCAYAGKREAAPLLWDSLKRIEGIWGGYYTGMVVNDGKQLNWKKCAGHMGIWESRFSLNDLPGTTGLIHSRTASGGDDRRSHPFVGINSEVALVSQGSFGIFQRDPFIACGNRMLAEGRKCRSAVADKTTLPTLSDGTQVCMSDIVVNAVEAEYLKHRDPMAAMLTVCSVLTEESSTIFLFRDRPGFIGFVNANQHVVYDFEQDGVYLSVTRIGLPGYGTEIPGNSAGYVTADGELYRRPLGKLYQPIDTRIPGGALDAFREYLQQYPRVLLSEVCDKAVRPLLRHEMLEYRAVTAYNILETFYFAGHIKMELVENQHPNVPALGNKFLLSWQ